MPKPLMSTKETLSSTSLRKAIPAGGQVFIGLSGGVDSAVSAALLKQRGFDVTGVFIKVWQPAFLPCSWRDERRDAMKVALALDIPFLFFDFESEYKKGVVDKMVAEYKAGRTPNPDVLCNKEIKFGAFWKKAREMGADYIATGHYASIKEGRLQEGKDKEKDQSYFLWTLTPEDLSHTLFPVGDLTKSEVRKLARKYNLPVSRKKDSQGICFIGDVSMDEFLSHFIRALPGDVLNYRGEIIGTHKGAVFYTIGERHGFEIIKKEPLGGAFYVLSKDMEANTITVSNKEPEIISHSPTKIAVKNVNWIAEPAESPLFARIRYRGEKVPVIVEGSVFHNLTVKFREPVRGLSLGQSIVFYDGETCLGGGVMDRVIERNIIGVQRVI
ncbi:MAG: tRNA 2-thiouridine(34) synthase MnmA [Parcubacteria group bacterium]